MAAACRPRHAPPKGFVHASAQPDFRSHVRSHHRRTLRRRPASPCHAHKHRNPDYRPCQSGAPGAARRRCRCSRGSATRSTAVWPTRSRTPRSRPRRRAPRRSSSGCRRSRSAPSWPGPRSHGSPSARSDPARVGCTRWRSASATARSADRDDPAQPGSHDTCGARSASGCAARAARQRPVAHRQVDGTGHLVFRCGGLRARQVAGGLCHRHLIRLFGTGCPDGFGELAQIGWGAERVAGEPGEFRLRLAAIEPGKG